MITHTPAETPGRLAEWLPAAGLDLDVLAAWSDPVPERLEHDALVVMGGPQQAYDDRSAPWLRATKALLRAAVGDGRPVLGICLGAQLLAEATGGRVAPGDAGPEYGVGLVAKRDAAGTDPVFGGMPLAPAVVQWHSDAIVDLPPGAELLAAGRRYPHQAFRVGQAGYGLQFHVEVDAAMVGTWASADEEQVRAAGLDPQELEAAVAGLMGELEEVWRPCFQRFATAATG